MKRRPLTIRVISETIKKFTEQGFSGKLTLLIHGGEVTKMTISENVDERACNKERD